MVKFSLSILRIQNEKCKVRCKLLLVSLSTSQCNLYSAEFYLFLFPMHLVADTLWDILSNHTMTAWVNGQNLAIKKTEKVSLFSSAYFARKRVKLDVLIDLLSSSQGCRNDLLRRLIRPIVYVIFNK